MNHNFPNHVPSYRNHTGEQLIIDEKIPYEAWRLVSLRAFVCFSASIDEFNNDGICILLVRRLRRQGRHLLCSAYNFIFGHQVVGCKVTGSGTLAARYLYDHYQVDHQAHGNPYAARGT